MGNEKLIAKAFRQFLKDGKKTEEQIILEGKGQRYPITKLS